MKKTYTYEYQKIRGLKRKVERPKLDVLISEIKEHSQEWFAIKYGVSRYSIRRWISK
jgi:hypothetical protein